MYDLRHVLLPGILLIDGAYDAQGDADHGEDHSHDSLCSNGGEGRGGKHQLNNTIFS